MDSTVTYTVGLDTPIHLLTPRQLFAMMDERQALTPQKETAHIEGQRWYVNSVKELAEIIGASESTVYRMKANGLLDDCISQYGRWMIIDVEKVIEKFKLSNIRKNRKANKKA